MDLVGFEDMRAASEWENDDFINLEDAYFTYSEMRSLGYELLYKGFFRLPD